MVKIFKIFKIVNALAFALSFSIAGSSVSKAEEMDRGLSGTWDHFFIYPSNVIDYSVSGSSLIEFNISSNGEVTNFHIIESLGIPFDKSIIDGLGHYVSKKIFSKKNNFNNKYRLEIKFEN